MHRWVTYPKLSVFHNMDLCNCQKFTQSNGPTYLHDVCSFNHPKQGRKCRMSYVSLRKWIKKNSTKRVPHVYFVNMFTEAKGK